MAALRHGFKAEANRYSTDLRREMNLRPEAPLCVWKLASHLEYKVQTLSDYAKAQPDAVAYLKSEKGQKEFSAITIPKEALIIHNDAHERPRQASNIAHEISHGLLVHVAMPLVGLNGARSFDREKEDEASWLGPALLVSEEAALHIVKSERPISEACLEYGVSEQLLTMRLRVTGALLRARRRRAA